MLHRLTLRVLPRLTLAATEESVRKRKRLVMLVAGLVAFAIYRVIKHLAPLSEPLTLLGLSGLISAATSAWAYQIGRSADWATIWREDGSRTVGWLVGWIGFAYGVQLSLMVLALLKILVNYDFFGHPEGPAMMAIIIACTSVARDALEIGHIQRLKRQGEPVLTFPDGAAFRVWFREQPGRLAQWGIPAALACAMLSSGLANLGEAGRTELGQLVAVSLFAGTLALWAYLAGEQRLRLPTPGTPGFVHSRAGGWRAILGTVGWSELFRFWWWPGLAFAATYYLTLSGAATFLFRLDARSGVVQSLMAGAVAGVMALYCYYLGYRRHLENQVQQMVPPSLLRCPFVMGILSKPKVVQSEESISPAGMALRETGRRG
ncbi:MAG: hypothetical protein ACREIH_09765 [Nitrospiraceae bacterium]